MLSLKRGISLANQRLPSLLRRLIGETKHFESSSGNQEAQWQRKRERKDKNMGTARPELSQRSSNFLKRCDNISLSATVPVSFSPGQRCDRSLSV